MICFISRFSRLSDESPASHFPEVAALSRDHLRDARSHKAQKQKCFYRVFHGEMEKYERIMVPILRLANKASRNWNRGLNRGNPSRVVWFKLGCLVGPQAVSSSLWPQLLFFIVSAWLQYIVERTFPLQFTFHLSIKPWNRNFGVSSRSSVAIGRWKDISGGCLWNDPLSDSHPGEKKTRFNDDVDRFNVQTFGFETDSVTDSHWYLQNSIHTGLAFLNQTIKYKMLSWWVWLKLCFFKQDFKGWICLLPLNPWNGKSVPHPKQKRQQTKMSISFFGSTYFFKTTVTLKR